MSEYAQSRLRRLEVALDERDLDFILTNLIPPFVQAERAAAESLDLLGAHCMAEDARELAARADGLAERLSAVDNPVPFWPEDAA